MRVNRMAKMMENLDPSKFLLGLAPAGGVRLPWLQY